MKEEKTFRVVEEERRMDFLPEHFGIRAMMGVEDRLYRYADLALEGYSGGLWDFVECSNGAGYMVPPTNPEERLGKVRLRESDVSYNGGTMSRDAAGLALTTLAVNHEWHHDPNNKMLAQSWRQLMAAAEAHPEAREIYRVLD